MGAFGRFIRSLTPGNDHQLAARDYTGRESASATAHRKRVERHQRHGAAKAGRHGEQWETRDRHRYT